MFPLPFDCPETEPEITEAVQENEAETISALSEIFVEPPEQISCEDGFAVADGNGFTVIW